MKKVFRLLFVLSFVFLLIGCSKDKTKEDKKEETLAQDEVVLEGIKYKLDQSDSEYGIKYKIASNFRKTKMVNAINYFSEKIDNESYFVIRILKYKKHDIKYAIKDSTTGYDKKWKTNINDKEYTVVRFKNPIGENTYTNIYYYTHKKDTYAFVFTSYLDLSRLEKIYLSQIDY